MNKQAVEILRAARALIERREAWTTDATARDSDGEWVPPSSDKAVCWCALGAIERASHSLMARGVRRFLAEVAAQDILCNVIHGSISAYNDTHTHRQVLRQMDRAIQAAEAVL